MKMMLLTIFFVTFLLAQGTRVSNNAIGSKTCQVGWKEIHDRIEYTPGSGLRVLFPDAELQLCDSPCETKNVSVRLTLATNHIGKGCDRDTYSVESQRKLCGASAESVDLLPTPGLGSEWTRDLPTDEGRESDQIYEFDGSTNAVVVPESTLNHNLSNKFAISFWMKHEPPASTDELGEVHSNAHTTSSSSNSKHIKEHILCNADDHKKNRHHYALFVRNCRLVLLLRQESYFASKHTIFKPAEWRWKLSQVCDNEWHHYSVSVDFPDVTLYIDGQMFKETLVNEGDKNGGSGISNPEIVDDWPLHTVHGVNTTLVVGACWEGRESKMSHHFHGYLAGLSVLRGRNENPQVLSCLHRCKEGLQLPPSDSLDPGTDVSVNSEATTVTIEGKDSIDVEDILSQISYVNSREFPTPGRRSLRVSTSIRCMNGKSIKIPSVYSYVVVLPPEQPSITVNGTSNIGHDYESFIQGIDLFSSVTISMNHEIEKDDVIVNGNKGKNNSPRSNDDNNSNDSSSEQDDTDDSNENRVTSKNDDSNNNNNNINNNIVEEHKLDACTVQVYPPLNSDHEFFKLPVNYMDHLGVHYKQTKDGVVIHGADSVKSYQTIIRQIVYFNRKPAYYLNRAFKLSCSELNGRFISNEYVQTLTVIHPKGPSTNGRVSTNDDSTGPRSVKTGHHSNQFTHEQVTSSSLSSSTSATVVSGDKIDDQHLSSDSGNKIGYESSAVNSAASTAPMASVSSSLNSIHHQQTPVQAKIQIQKQKVEVKDSHVRSASANSFVHHSPSNLGTSHPSPIVVGHAVLVIIVVCIGFLVFLVVLGVIRIRAAHRRTSELGLNGRPCGEDDTEMAWDDTALTITVNPLEQLVDHESNESNCIDDDEDDSSSSTSYHEEEEGDSSEEDEPVEMSVASNKTKGTNTSGNIAAGASTLSWDDSALNF